MPARSPVCEETFLPYRRLAISVLTRAIRDASDPAVPVDHRDSARAFLAGSGLLAHWCQVAAINMHSLSPGHRR